MLVRRPFLFLALPILLASGCRPPPPPPPAPPPEPEQPLRPAPFEVAWTAGTAIVAPDSGTAIVVPPGTRLDVTAVDSAGLRVRCGRCERPDEGLLTKGELVTQPQIPLAAATGSLGEFALALRAAAEARDLPALREVMAPEFSFVLEGSPGRDLALSTWEREGFRSLDAVPELLDGGLFELNGLWVAPHEFARSPNYHGPRLGIARAVDGRWEWLFLIRGLREP